MILLIDNYDSFVYNLYQYIGEFNPDIKVIRNDELTLDQIKQLDFEAMVISPGPGRPDQAGVCEDAIRYFYDKKPILGVCLGHQALCEVFGHEVTYAPALMHGKSSLMHILKDTPLTHGIKTPTIVARYHSLVAKEAKSDLDVIGTSDDGCVMAVKHKDYPVYGVQFHPESIMTIDGKRMIQNFLEAAND